MKLIKKAAIFTVSIIIVIALNLVFVFVARIIENPNNFVPIHSGSFEEILLGDNSNVKLSDYVLSNMGSLKNCKDATEIIEVLNKGRYDLVGDTKRAFIQSVTTEKSYIAQLWLDKIDGVSTEDVKTREWMSNALGAARTCEIIKLSNSYYVILGIVSSSVDDIENCYYDAIYKLSNKTPIVELEGFNYKMKSYSRDYPTGIFSYFFNSTLGKLLYVFIIFSETIIITVMLTLYISWNSTRQDRKKKNTGDGSKPLK